jgi:hypothetical protein
MTLQTLIYLVPVVRNIIIEFTKRKTGTEPVSNLFYFVYSDFLLIQLQYQVSERYNLYNVSLCGLENDAVDSIYLTGNKSSFWHIMLRLHPCFSLLRTIK